MCWPIMSMFRCRSTAPRTAPGPTWRWQPVHCGELRSGKTWRSTGRSPSTMSVRTGTPVRKASSTRASPARGADLPGLVALGHGAAPVDDAQAGDVAAGHALEHLLDARHVALAHRALHALDDRLPDGEHQVRGLLDRPVALVAGHEEHEHPENQRQGQSERDDQLRSELHVLHACTPPHADPWSRPGLDHLVDDDTRVAEHLLEIDQHHHLAAVRGDADDVIFNHAPSPEKAAA